MPDLPPVRESIVLCDLHAGLSPAPGLDLGFVRRWREAGASYVSLNVGYDGVMSWQDTVACAAYFHRWVDTHPDICLPARTAADIREAKRQGKIAVAFDIEGANALNGDISMLCLYHRMGVRHMNFAYNRNNAFGGGCHDEDIPLSDLGRQAVAEMNRLGMIVDCSHTGYTTSLDIMALSTKPVIFSHSNPRRLYDHPRNIRDEQIKACAAMGGVIGINGISTFLGNDDCSPARMADHVCYVADLVGIEHVAIGLDSVLDPEEFPRLVRKFPHIWPDAAGEAYLKLRCAMPEQISELAEELSSRCLSDSDVGAVMGANFLRVAEAVWG